MNDMITLSIDTCIGAGSIALFTDTELIAEMDSLRSDRRRTDPAQALQLLLSESGLRTDSIDRVIVTRGPGSFSGVRSGLSFVKGLLRTRGVSVVTITVFQAFLSAAMEDAETAKVVLFAGREEVACQSFSRERTSGELVENGQFSILKFEELMAAMRREPTGMLIAEKRLDETDIAKNLSDSMPNIEVVVPGRSVARLAMSFCSSRRVKSLENRLEAIYSREFAGGVPRK